MLLMKWGYPLGVTALAVMALVVMSVGGASRWSAEYLAQIAFMIVIGAFMYGQYVKGLVESVYDCGDHLDVRSGKGLTSISLGDVTNVCYEEAQPYRVTLVLNRPCALGDVISFLPRVPTIRLVPSRPVVEALVRDLSERAQQMRPKDVSA